jgi:hypothetical protein
MDQREYFIFWSDSFLDYEHSSWHKNVNFNFKADFFNEQISNLKKFKQIIVLDKFQI